jgi:ribonuclease J
MMFVDGLQIGGAEHVVLRERQQLSGDGILIAVVTVSVQTGESVAPPELVARGFLYDEDTENDLLAEAADSLAERLRELTGEHTTGQRLLREDIHDTLAQFIYRRTRREPLILPVVVEI